jgi:hypothetical protein
MELVPLALAKAAKGMGQMSVEAKSGESTPVEEKRPKENWGERRRQGKDKEKAPEKAYAVTAPVAVSKPAFAGECYNCHKKGHMKAECSDLKSEPAGKGRKPGAECNCHKTDSHTEDECWEKNPHMRPDKWQKRKGDTKPAYAADTLEPWAPPAAEMEQPGFTAWTAAISTNCPREAFAVFDDEGPELRPTTVQQRDTEPAARAKGEADRQAARAKEDRVRLGGPPPGFRPQGERRAAEEMEAAPAAPRADRRRGQASTAAPVAEPKALPLGFGEYSPGDPRCVGLTDAEQSGVHLELLAAPVAGPVQGEVVQRRPPTAYMVDIERDNPDSPDPVDIEWEAMLVLLLALATEGGPTESEGDASAPGTAANVPPQVAQGGIKDVQSAVGL